MNSHLEQILMPLSLWDTCMGLSPMTEDPQEINAILERQQEAGGGRRDELKMSQSADTWVEDMYLQTICEHKSVA